MKQSLEKRIILFSFIILFLTILANTGMDIAVFRRNYIQEMILRTQSLGTSLRSNIEKVLALGIDIRDVNGLGEKCKELVQSDPEITYCVVSGPDGRVLYSSDSAFSGLDLAKGIPVSGLEKGISAATIIISGNKYYNTSTQVRSFDAKTVASINVGFNQAYIDHKVNAIILRSFIVFLFFFMLSFALVIFFVKRSIIAPISILLDGVKKIASGNFQTFIKELPVYEFNELGAKINSMSKALDTRDTELRSNYEELSLTHGQLHNSFLKLEQLSLKLEKSEELYKKLLEEASDAIIILDDSERIIIANRKAEEFLGFPAAEIIGLHISNLLLLLKSENIPHLLQMFKRASGGSYIAEEITITNKRDEHQIGRIHASSINMGDINLIQVIIRDVTKEREILTNLENSAAGLVRLNKMKDSFLGLASHELKTPLTVIMGYTELLLSDMKHEVGDTAVEMIQNISGAANRLDAIVKDMVDVSMIDQKQLDLKLHDVQVNKIIEDILREMRFFFTLRKQDIVTRLDESQPNIKGDLSRLIQLFSNIVGNAIKFTPDGGRISVTTRVVQLERNKPSPSYEYLQSLAINREFQRYIEIVVTDSGIGIDPDEQQRIFEKFYEAGNIEEHSSGKVAFKARGAGLGLSIAKGIAEMHGGEIRVESSGYDPINCPGSSFFILLPLDQSG